MVKRLVIVESPTKARTLKRFLGSGYLVESSVGHVRDLPANAAEIPAAYKKEPWARLGVNVEDDFKPLYVVQPEKKKRITELKRLLKEVDELLLATDEDREGEAISWHLLQLLQPKVPVKRMVFHEITKEAILHSLASTRDLDQSLVGAQETRRIIDRLYGYEVSPILWRKIGPRLSAGRVQSVAIRMIVEREQERMRFHAAHYWDLVADFRAPEERTGADAVPDTFPARLQSVDGRRLAGGKDFDPDTGTLRKSDLLLLDGEAANRLRAAMAGGRYRVESAEEKPFTRSPAPPFTTSTLQQEGNRKLRFDAKRTMRAAQRLYENGFITYMRTDSVVLSSDAIRLTRDAIRSTYGDEYLPDQPRSYRHKVKNAQEAHEAIRPAGNEVAPVETVARKLGPDEAKVYELIWKRTLACQMKDARGRRMTVRVAGSVDGQELVFTAGGNVIDFPGFLRAYVESSDDPEAALAERETLLPPLQKDDPLGLGSVEVKEHVTTPPARLTEATLVRALEESGIGRPSTYATIIDTIQRREYTFKKGSALVPTFTAFAVVRLMQGHLTDLIDTAFTARMEDRLDAISRGEYGTLPYLREFYFGNGSSGLKPLVEQKVEDIDARSVCAIPLGRDEEMDEDIYVRVGRYGPFLQRGETTASIPEQTCPDELTLERARELLRVGELAERPIGHHPETGAPVYVKTGRYGPYVQLGDADPEEKKKPKMVSLLAGMTPETMTFELALKLLSLPRVLGQDEKGVEVEAHTGRYGPYIKRGSDTRSLGPDDDILTIELPRALDLLAQEKKGRGFRRSAEPIKVFEKVEALEGADVKLLDGRYGPYVTDGEVNASLPRGHADPASLRLEEALELLAAQRAKKGRRKKKSTKKTAKAKKKTAAKKKTSKKKTSKKTAKGAKSSKKKGAKKSAKKTEREP